VDAYTQALAWLARRELSEAQLRSRLARRRRRDAEDADIDANEEIDEAIARLKRERALDDRRVALAFARSAVTLKGRGRDRIRRDIEALGIDRTVARSAIDEVFGEVDESAVLDRALTRRWPRTGAPPDQRALQRIYRALLQQGFPPDKVLNAFRARRATLDDD
jgi:SOS response regulatory protein OraA/RecX